MTTILLLLIIFMVKFIQRFYKFIYKKIQLIKYKVSPFKKNPIESIYNLVLNVIVKLGITLICVIIVSWFGGHFLHWGYTLGYDGFVNLVIDVLFNLFNFLKDSYVSIFDFYIKTCNNAYIYMQPPQEPIYIKLADASMYPGRLVYIKAAESYPDELHVSKISKYSCLPLLVLNTYIAMTFYIPVVSELAIAVTWLRGGYIGLAALHDFSLISKFNVSVDAYNASVLKYYENSLLLYNMQKAAEIPEPMEEFC